MWWCVCSFALGWIAHKWWISPEEPPLLADWPEHQDVCPICRQDDCKVTHYLRNSE